MVEQICADVGPEFPRLLGSAELSPDSETGTTPAAATNIYPDFEEPPTTPRATPDRPRLRLVPGTPGANLPPSGTRAAQAK